MNKILERTISLPKTIWFNFKCLNLKEAFKFPFLVNYNVKIVGVNRRNVKITCPIKNGIIKIGYGGSDYISPNQSSIIIKKGEILFDGKCTLTRGCNIYVNNGKLIISNNVYANRNLTIQCEKSIYLGNDSLIGWDVAIRDTDGHGIYKNGKIKPLLGEIIIKNHVWIASNVTILKNCFISENSVIACNSLVSNYKYQSKGEFIAGIPAIKKKDNINWEE